MSRLKEKAFWIAIGDIAGRGLTFGASIYLARALGAELFGLITVAISVLGYAIWFADLGLNTIGTREAAKAPEKRFYRIIEVFSLKVILGILVFALSAFIIYSSSFSSTEKEVVLGYLFSILPYMVLMEWLYAGKQEFGKIAVSKVLNGGVYFTLVVLLINSTEDILLVPVFYTSGVCSAALFLGAFAFRNKAFNLPWRGFGIFPDLLKNSTVLGAGKFFAQIVQLLPPLLIGTFLTLSDAGLYGAAFRIILIAMLADRIFVNLLLPNLASLWVENKAVAREKVNLVYRVVLAGGTGIALFTAIAAPQIIKLFYGAEYAGSTMVLQLLSVMISFTFINSLFSFGLIATGHDKEYFYATGIGGSIATGILVISALLGSVDIIAASVSAAEVVITLFTFNLFSRVISLNYVRPALTIFTAAITLYVTFTFVPFLPIINGLIAVLIFILISYMTGILNRKHSEWLKEKLLK